MLQNNLETDPGLPEIPAPDGLPCPSIHMVFCGCGYNFLGPIRYRNFWEARALVQSHCDSVHTLKKSWSKLLKPILRISHTWSSTCLLAVLRINRTESLTLLALGHLTNFVWSDDLHLPRSHFCCNDQQTFFDQFRPIVTNFDQSFDQLRPRFC